MAPRGMVVFAAGVTAMAVLSMAYLHTGRLGRRSSPRPVLAPVDDPHATPPQASLASPNDLGMAVSTNGATGPAAAARGGGGGGAAAAAGGGGGGGGNGVETKVLAPAGRICCKQPTAQCLSCAQGVKVATFCAVHPTTPGCPPALASAAASATVSTTAVVPTTLGLEQKQKEKKASGAVANPVVVGDCVGNNYGLLANPRKFIVELVSKHV